MSEYQLLQQYVVCLERENQAKNTQRQTLYNQMERLQQDIKSLQQELSLAKKKAQQYQDSQLNRQIRDLQEQIAILKHQQDQIFEQNLSIVNLLAQSDNKIQQLQKQNKQLKHQKQELQKFRVTLQKISKSLDGLQKQRLNLSQVNYNLAQENLYLKNIINGSNGFNAPKNAGIRKENQQLRINHQYHSNEETNLNDMRNQNYLMNEFQKISEYDQEYQESHQDSITKSKSNKSYNNSSQKKSIKEHKNNEINKKQQIMNNSSYLILDQSSREQIQFDLNNQNHSVCQNQKGQYNQQSEQTFAQKSNLRKSFGHRNQSNNGHEGLNSPKRNDQSSCDVIQQLYDQVSHQLDRRNTSDFQTAIKVQKLKTNILQLEQRLQMVSQRLSKSQQQRRYLQNRIVEMQKSQNYNINQMQSKIQELLKNYQIIQHQNNHKNYEIQKMTQYIKKLQFQNEGLYNRIMDYQNMEMQKFKNQTKNSKKMKKKSGSLNNDFPLISQSNNQYSDYQNLKNHHQQKFDSIDKSVLIKQNNQLIQQLSKLQRQKNYLYQQLSQSHYYSQNDQNVHPNENWQLNQRKMRFQTENQSYQHHDFKKANSAYMVSEPRRSSSSQYQKKSNKENIFNLRNKKQNLIGSNYKNICQNLTYQIQNQNDKTKRNLKKRIEIIRKQNERLLKELQFN